MNTGGVSVLSPRSAGWSARSSGTPSGIGGRPARFGYRGSTNDEPGSILADLHRGLSYVLGNCLFLMHQGKIKPDFDAEETLEAVMGKAVDAFEAYLWQWATEQGLGGEAGGL
jgi:hypothetical protein